MASQEQYILRAGGDAGLSSLHFSPPVHVDTDAYGSYLLASGYIDGHIRVWSTRRRRVQCEWPYTSVSAAPAGVLNVQFASARTLLSQYRDGTINCWDIEHGAGKPIMTLPTESWSFCKFSVLLSSNDNDDDDDSDDDSGRVRLLLAPAHKSSLVSLYDPHQKKSILTFDCDDAIQRLMPNDVNNNKFGMVMTTHLMENPSTNEVWMVLGGEGGRLLLASTRMPSKAVAYVDAASNIPLMSVGVMSKRSSSFRCVCASPEAALSVCKLDMDNAKVTKLPITIELPNAGVSDIAVRSDNKIFATAGWDHRVRVFDCKHNRPLAVLKLHDGSVQAVAFARMQRDCPPLLATGGKDARIGVYSMYPASETK